MTDWQLDLDRWPGPDRRKWPDLGDVLQESPGGKHLAVVYSCGEVGVDKQIGRFALLGGPPAAPRILLRPRRLTCLVRYDGTTVRWIGERYCVVTPYSIRPRLSGTTLAYLGTLYLDVERHRAASLAGEPSAPAGGGLPPGLKWGRWGWLVLWPWVSPG
jgi:hypothetical protein